MIDQKLIDPKNMKIFEKVMPGWYELIMETQTWEEFRSVIILVMGSEHIELYIGRHDTGMIGEIYGFAAVYSIKDSKEYDAVLLAFSNKFAETAKRGEGLEHQKQTKEVKAMLNKTRITFSEQINECMNYLRKKYPKQCNKMMNEEITA